MKILVADDHEFVRGGIVSELSSIIKEAVFIEAGNANEVLNCLDENNDIQLAILDLYMPGANQYALIDKVCQLYPDIKVVVMTASEDSRDMNAVIKLGVLGYIPKSLGKDIVHHALRLILSGGSYFPGSMENNKDLNPINKFSSTEIQNKITKLTHRQKDVLNHLLKGEPNKSIADILSISENTVKIHVTAILKSLSFNSRAQVIASLLDSELDLN